MESARVIKECLDGKGIPTPTGKVGVWLDSPMLDILHGEGRVRTAFVGKWKVYERLGIDISKAPMLVYPTLHYQNGGLKDNAECETVVPGLYVAGEVTGGLHGENRLMGNSLMDIVVFGRIAGRNAAIFAREKAKEGKLTLKHVKRYHKELKEAGIIADRVAPMLLPDYTTPEIKEKQLTVNYLGTLRSFKTSSVNGSVIFLDIALTYICHHSLRLLLLRHLSYFYPYSEKSYASTLAFACMRSRQYSQPHKVAQIVLSESYSCGLAIGFF